MSKAKSDKTTVTLAHGAFVGGKYVGPGEKVEVSNDDAGTLTAAGYVVTDEPVGETGAASA